MDGNTLGKCVCVCVWRRRREWRDPDVSTVVGTAQLAAATRPRSPKPAGKNLRSSFFSPPQIQRGGKSALTSLFSHSHTQTHTWGSCVEEKHSKYKVQLNSMRVVIRLEVNSLDRLAGKIDLHVCSSMVRVKTAKTLSCCAHLRLVCSVMQDKHTWLDQGWASGRVRGGGG